LPWRARDRRGEAVSYTLAAAVAALAQRAGKGGE